MLPGKHLAPDGCPKQERLRRRVSSLFLNNTLSALDACELARDAEAAGAGNIRGLARIGERRKDGVPQARDVRTYLSKNSHWPPLYWFEAAVFDRKEQKNVRTMLPMLLPYEVFSVMRETEVLPALDHTVYWRRQRAGQQAGRACLEIRADWAFFKQVLYMPAWRLGCIRVWGDRRLLKPPSTLTRFSRPLKFVYKIL